MSPLWHWLGWIHRQQILGYTCGIWRSMPSFYEVVDLKYKKTADWYICESFVSLKTWNYNILIIEGLFSQEEEEVEFRKKSSIISKLPNFISQSKQMQCIPSKSIGPKWKSKKFSKKGAAVKKKGPRNLKRFSIYIWIHLKPLQNVSSESSEPWKENPPKFKRISELFKTAYCCAFIFLWFKMFLSKSIFMLITSAYWKYNMQCVSYENLFFFSKKVRVPYIGALIGGSIKNNMISNSKFVIFIFLLIIRKINSFGFCPPKTYQFQWHYLDWF